jgi:hypothetical protein
MSYRAELSHGSPLEVSDRAIGSGAAAFLTTYLKKSCRDESTQTRRNVTLSAACVRSGWATIGSCG